MRIVLLFMVVSLASCDVFRGGSPRPKTELQPQEFVDVYVALSKAQSPAEKAGILRKHKTSEKAMQEFITAYSKNLQELSLVFDSVLARQSGAQLQTVPH